MHVLLCVVIKEILQLRHDRKMIPVLIVGPIAQLLALGYAASLDVTNIPLLILDHDRTVQSRALVDRFVASGYFDLVGTEETPDRVEPWLLTGRAQVAVVIADGYGKALLTGQTAKVQAIADGTDSKSALVGIGYVANIVGVAGVEAVTARLVRRGTTAESTDGATAPALRRASVELVPRVWYNADLRSRWFYVPAVLALVLMLVTLLLPSMAVVREKEIGTMEQLLVTPIRPWQLIGGKLLPYVVIGMFDFALITAIMRLLFGIPLRGSFLLLSAMTMLFLMSTLGLGLLVSTAVRTQQQAMMFSIFVVMIPMIYLSGLIFPIESMPIGFRYGTIVIPVRYYANVLRGVFLRGSGIDILWPDAVILAVMGAITLLLASLRFRRSLD